MKNATLALGEKTTKAVETADIEQRVSAAMAVDEIAYAITTETMRQAFEAVQHPRDWRGPIDAVVDADQLAITILAIQFYTATMPTVEPTQSRPPACHAQLTRYRVRSVGYRMGPAGS